MSNKMTVKEAVAELERRGIKISVAGLSYHIRVKNLPSEQRVKRQYSTTEIVIDVDDAEKLLKVTKPRGMQRGGGVNWKKGE